MARLSFSSCALAVALAFGSVSAAQAGTIPYGPQNDVSDATVASWGWSEHYVGSYGDWGGVAISSVFAGLNANDWVMIGGRRTGSGVVDVLAAARLSDVLMQTPLNAPHQANGAEWYSNGYSMGFAGLGDTIYQNSADINGLDWMGGGERDRLSWHTSAYPYWWQQDANLPAVLIEYGWRSGTNIVGGGWDRVVWVQATPEPHEWALIALAMGGFAFFVIRRQQLAVG